MVSRKTAITDVFGEIHSILNSNVQTITDSAGNSVTLTKSSSGNYWFGSFPDLDLNQKSSFPIGIINTPEVEDSIEGYRYIEKSFTVDLLVFGTRADHPPSFIQEATYYLRENEDTLRDEGLYQLETNRSTTDMTQRGDLKVHSCTLPITLNFGDEV